MRPPVETARPVTSKLWTCSWCGGRAGRFRGKGLADHLAGCEVAQVWCALSAMRARTQDWRRWEPPPFHRPPYGKRRRE